MARQPFSESTDGQPIGIGSTAADGDLVHSVPRSGEHVDEVHLWATNREGTTTLVTVQFGNTPAAQRIEVNMAAQDTQKIIDGVPLRNGDIRVFAGSADVVSCFGYVDRR